MSKSRRVAVIADVAGDTAKVEEAAEAEEILGYPGDREEAMAGDTTGVGSAVRDATSGEVVAATGDVFGRISDWDEGETEC